MSIRRLLISAGFVLVLVAAAAASVVAGVVPVPGTPTAGVHDATAKGPFRGPVYQVKERVVNLADPGARRYLKFALALQFESESPEYERAEPRERSQMEARFAEQLGINRFIIDDTLTTLLSATTVADVTTQAGKEALREEIRNTLNTVMLGDHRITQVLFTEFVVQ